MKVLLVNLDRDKERLDAADKQLHHLGVPYARWRAIDARSLTSGELDGAVNRFRWWCAVGRPVRVGEIGCAMSHYAIYRQMTEPVCVLEDDVLLDGRFAEVLSYVEQHIDVEKPQVVLLSNHTRRGVGACGTEPGMCRVKSDMYTEGYVLTPLAAQELLKANWPLQTPCDWWGRWVKRGVIELYHAFPTVCRQDQTQYKSGTVDPNSFNVHNLSWPRWIWHKALRLIGKSLDRALR